MRSKSPENSASSPPVPARISRNRLRPSLGSRGNSSSCSAPSSSSILPRLALISSSAMAFMSGSDSISCAVARSSSLRTKAVKASTTGSSSARSRESLRKRSMSDAVSGSASMASTSMRRWHRCSSRLRMDDFMMGGTRMEESGWRARGADARRKADAASAANGGVAAGEQARHPGKQLLAVLAFAAVQRRQRAMQVFLGQAVGQLLQHGLGRFAARQHAARALQLGGAHILGGLVQVADDGHHFAGLHPVHEALDAGFDDGLGLHHGGAARVGAGLHQAAQVVHRIQVDVVQAADFGFDIARHGQVDHDHRAVAAAAWPAPPSPARGWAGSWPYRTRSRRIRRGGRSGPTASWCWPRNDWPAARRARPCDWPRPCCAGVARRSEWRRVRSSRRRR